MTIALIDGDIVNYRVGFTTEDVDFPIAKFRVDEMLDNILLTTNAKEFRIYLTAESDKTAFRKSVYPEYKANRKAEKPRWYREIREYLNEEWGAETVQYIEADDALGMAQTPQSIICSIDKDLLQIQGRHYNFVKQEFSSVNELDGWRHFYSQLITGDTSDNLKGLPGRGPAFAKKKLGNLSLEQDLFDAVRELYHADGFTDEYLIQMGRCLWIWKQENDDWINHYNTLIGEENENQIGRGAPAPEGTGSEAESIG